MKEFIDCNDQYALDSAEAARGIYDEDPDLDPEEAVSEEVSC